MEFWGPFCRRFSCERSSVARNEERWLVYLQARLWPCNLSKLRGWDFEQLPINTCQDHFFYTALQTHYIYSCTCTLNINKLIRSALRTIIRFPMLCTCETQGTQQMISMQNLKLSSLPRAELRTLKYSPGAGDDSTAFNPAAFICNFYYLFGFQFRVISPFSSRPLSQVHTVIGMLAMRWMEIRVHSPARVHRLTQKAILGGE